MLRMKISKAAGPWLDTQTEVNQLVYVITEVFLCALELHSHA